LAVFSIQSSVPAGSPRPTVQDGVNENLRLKAECGSFTCGLGGNDIQGAEVPRWKIPIFVKVVEPAAHEELNSNLDSQVRRYSKAAECQNVIETKGDSCGQRRPSKTYFAEIKRVN